MFLDKLPSLYLASSASWLPNVLPGKPFVAVKDESDTYTSFWDTVTPSSELRYHDCFDDFKCARLRVPMDWNNITDPRTVEIAIVKVPATVPVTDPTYGGPVLINPGGPGGSGIGFALKEGKDIRTVVSAGPGPVLNRTGLHFDVIGFDPRGVNHTTPSFNCFPDNVQATAFQLESLAIGALDTSEASFDTHWARMRALASGCSKRALESGIGEYMSTSSVARDIIEIVERHGEWREAEARRLLRQSSPLLRGAQKPLTREADVEILERVRHKPGKEMVHYWGFSYGTVLGATLAAMYPEKISRTVLDGVCDSFDYMEGGWLTNLQDTDMQIARFGEYCWLGGPDRCAMYHEDGPAVIVENLLAVVKELKANPIGVSASSEFAAGVATYGDLKDFFWEKTYKPLANFPGIAKVMKELSHGNGTGLIQSKLRKGKALSQGIPEQCSKHGPYSKACFNDTIDFDITTGMGILCTDAENQTNMTKDEYRHYVEELMDQSKLIGDMWGMIRLPCTQWNIRPKWRYEGNFTAETAHPLLFVSNTLDNVTPLRNAIKMSKGFPGSAILQQDTEGHCSSASVSFCTARALRAYFQTGKLPEKGTVCTPARLPFDGFSEEEEPAMPEGETDIELWHALVHMNK